MGFDDKGRPRIQARRRPCPAHGRDRAVSPRPRAGGFAELALEIALHAGRPDPLVLCHGPQTLGRADDGDRPAHQAHVQPLAPHEPAAMLVTSAGADGSKMPSRTPFACAVGPAKARPSVSALSRSKPSRQATTDSSSTGARFARTVSVTPDRAPAAGWLGFRLAWPR
jgi:hypothetical protein